mmetsp:Transcript_29440/g.68800  ORF Transcript_29440/g.68800 Transcript_29440/m.68800 type:complete len:173 (-) Transcript_29440:543-1061(-)
MKRPPHCTHRAPFRIQQVPLSALLLLLLLPTLRSMAAPPPALLRIPRIGLGTFQLKGDVAKGAVLEGLKQGFRLVDTARVYRNEESIGEALKEAEEKLGIRREEVFVTSKIGPGDQGYDKAIAACEESLRLLGTDYLDLLLIHWPGGGGPPLAQPPPPSRHPHTLHTHAHTR